ncbi:MAG TPA: matrixin family metalloprotease [Opitutaceae bacterium]|nr:matrixin family metalloprotease [Opitutaceae bacterium]
MKPLSSSTKRLRFAALAVVLLSLTGGGWAFVFVLNSNTGLPIKWPAGTVQLHIMLGSDRELSDGSTFNSSAAAAAESWNTVLGSVRLVPIQTSGNAAQRNGRNDLVFATTVYGQQFGENTVAVATGFSQGNERIESDIIFNSARTWDSYRGPTRSGVQDIRRVTLHEIGHLLGLDHPDEAGQNVAAVMNSRISNLDALSEDDITGGQSLYGPPGVPPNDAFANATSITLADGRLTVNGHNTNATKEPGEPNHGANPGGSSVWWRWTAPEQGTMTVETRGSYYDTTLGVYIGSTVSSLTTIASNDDINPGIIQASSVSFTAIRNTTYHIGIDGWDRDTGGITLTLNFAPSATAIPVILSPPASVVALQGGNATFAVTADGAGPLNFQWSFNNSDIIGATNAVYTLSGVSNANAGQYRVTVSNPFGSVTSNPATLTVTIPAPPPITGGGGGGGGGGGSPSVWFLGALLAAALGRLLQIRLRRA